MQNYPIQIWPFGLTLSVICLLVVMSGSSFSAAETQRTKASERPLPRWKDNTGMVYIRGGEFVRGGKYKVRVRSFYVDQHEVTNDQYSEFLNDGNERYWNEKQEIQKKDGRFVPKSGKERWPVYCVAWSDVAAYAKWAGKRLPTEAEWEYAAGGKENRKYPWGNEPITPDRANFGRNVGHPQPVGSYPEGKTPDGIYDMSGNVAEWCSDWFGPGYYKNAPEDDPRGPDKGERYVRRGGCWAMARKDQESAARGASAPDYRPKCIGIRCVRSARRVLLLLGENFEEIELAAFTGILGWATETKRVSNGVLSRQTEGAEVPNIEVVVAGFDEEVRGMGSMRVRSDVLVQDLEAKDIDRFDAVAIPACVGAGRGQHTGKGQDDLLSEQTLAIVRRAHNNGCIIAAMCWAENVLREAKLLNEKADYPLYTTNKKREFRPLVFDEKTRTITCGGPLVATETACLLLKALIGENEYRAFRQNNPWLFGINDEFSPRLESVR